MEDGPVGGGGGGGFGGTDAATSAWCRREWSVLAARQSHTGLRVIPVDMGSRSDILADLQEVAADHDRVVAAVDGLTGGPMTPADHLAAHNAWLRRQYRSAKVLGREPFSLSDVYVPTDCGQVRWGDLTKTEEPIDPFDDEVGGRQPLLDTVIDLFDDPDFQDLVVVQGPAGSGKSAFTLHLADHLQDRGLAPVLVRFRDLHLSTYGNVDELLADAVRVAPINEHPPPPMDSLGRSAATSTEPTGPSTSTPAKRPSRPTRTRIREAPTSSAPRCSPCWRSARWRRGPATPPRSSSTRPPSTTP